MANHLGRCKDCDYTIFATSEDVQDAESFREVTAGTGVYRVGNNGCFARCSNRHKFFACKLVKGTYSPDHKCDSRCLNAKGWSCTCSCGGANHGRGHAVTVTQASELEGHVHGPATTRTMESAIGDYGDLNREAAAATPYVPFDPEHCLCSGSTQCTACATSERRENGKHLGEVGKTIRGEVRIARVIFLNSGKSLYKFITEAGDSIDWFIAPEHDPRWEAGKTLTIRAKVKAHESHSRFGNSTVVIYVEEVE